MKSNDKGGSMLWGFDDLAGFFSYKSFSRILAKGKWGLEKESLRIARSGELALTPHPAVFGDKIDNPVIKTDFSESQIEMITPALDSIEEADEYLKYLHSVVERGIGDELLWPLSMPGKLPDDDKIPVAVYNNSEQGRDKEIYRAGLALRYGKRMQMISGIHYNFSFSEGLWEILHKRFAPESALTEFVNDTYFALARNFLRHRWLLVYLFGASPVKAENRDDESPQNVTDKCRDNSEQVFPDATSLRMSSYGYGGGVSGRYTVSYNSIREYVRDLRGILTEKSTIYSSLGIFREGRQVQLNDNVLQTENEYYAPLRFKRSGGKFKTQLDNLEADGVQYLELRIFDLNPFYVAGISSEQMHFIHLFILYCLFERSDPFTGKEAGEADTNARLAATRGREEGLILSYSGEDFSIRDRGREILDKMRIIADLIDNADGSDRYNRCLENEYMALEDIELLPSSWIVREMKRNNEMHTEFGLRRSVENRYYFCMDEFNSSAGLIPGNDHCTGSSRCAVSNGHSI